MFGEGISKSGELLDLAVQLGIVQKSGAWFGYGETRLGQGRDNTKIYLEEHPELFAEIEKQVRENGSKLNAGKKGAAAKKKASIDDAPRCGEARRQGGGARSGCARQARQHRYYGGRRRVTISRIAKTKQGRFSLFDENGDFLFSIDGETMVKNHVREGAALDAASLEALKEQSDTRKAKDKALGYLSLRDHASGELYDRAVPKIRRPLGGCGRG